MTLLLAALAPVGITAFGMGAGNCSATKITAVLSSCTADSTHMCTNSCGQFMKAHGDECSKDMMMGSSVKGMKAVIDKYCVAGCSAISFSATCTTELSTLGSLMKTGKLSTFCNGACFKFMSDNKCAVTGMPGQSAKQNAEFKKSMSSIVGMCSSSGKSGCQMMGFAAKCTAMMNTKHFKMTSSFCATPCMKFINDQKCGQTGILGLPASDSKSDDSKDGMASMTAMCRVGMPSLKNKAGQDCSPMTVMGTCSEAADDLKDEPCNSACAKVLVPCADVVVPWMRTNMAKMAKMTAMVKPFEARCKGHLSGASGALIPGGTTSKPTGAWGGGMSKPTGAAPCKMSQMLMSKTCGATDMTCKAQALGGATGACWKCAVAACPNSKCDKAKITACINLSGKPIGTSS